MRLNFFVFAFFVCDGVGHWATPGGADGLLLAVIGRLEVVLGM